MAMSKSPIDHVSNLGTQARAERFAEIARHQGETIGRKEMAMTKRPRDEDSAERAERFIDMERRRA